MEINLNHKRALPLRIKESESWEYHTNNVSSMSDDIFKFIKADPLA